MERNIKVVDNEKSKGLKFILFLVSPLLSLIYSLNSLNTKSSRVVIFLFCLFFGLAFTVTDIRTEGSPDGITYRSLFQDYHGIGKEAYQQTAQEYFTFSGGVKDFYADTMAYVVSRFTDNYHIFFMVIAMVFAFFQIKTLKYLTGNKNFVAGVTCLLLVFLFTFVSIKNINGLRFWTAYWIACYCLFRLILDKKLIYLIPIATLPFFHASFVVVWILVALYYATGNFGRIWTFLLILSLFFGNLSLSLLQENASYLPEFLTRFVDYYASDEIVARVNAAGSGFYLMDRIFPVFVNIYLNIMLLLINRERSKIIEPSTKRLLAFTVIVVSFANFVMPIPSLGKRFMVLSYPLIAYLWLDVFGTHRYKNYLYMIPIVFFMSIYHLIEAYVQNVDVMFYISSPIIDLVRFL